MKKVIFILTVLILAVCICSCDNQSDDNSNHSSGEHKIAFPVSDKDKTEFNASIYETEPFTLSITLNDAWTYEERNSASDSVGEFMMNGVWSVLDMFDADGNRVGALGYCTYIPYEGAEDSPQAIYSQIALGNDYHFDVRESYKAVKETGSGETATADVYYSESVNGTEKINKGIVSYNKDLLVYIALELDGEAVSDDELIAIAESIEISE